MSTYKIRVTEIVTESLEDALRALSVLNRQQLPSLQLGASLLPPQPEAVPTAQPSSSNGNGAPTDLEQRMKAFVDALSSKGRSALEHLMAAKESPLPSIKLGKAMGWKSARGAGSLLKGLRVLSEQHKVPLPVEILQNADEPWSRWQIRSELKPYLQQALQG